MTSGEFDQRLVLPPGLRPVAALALLLAGGATAHGLIFDPQRLWPNLLLGSFFLLSLAVAGLFFLAAQRLCGARWSAGLRRIPEALMLMLPWASLAMLSLYLGRHALFPWTQADVFAADPPYAGRGRYLTEAGVFGRAVATFAIWTLAAWRLRWISLVQDRDPAGNLATHDALNRTAALFIVLFAPTFTLNAYDWILSLEPHWFSTMFAVYVFAGTFVNGIAAVTVIVLLLRRHRSFRAVVGPQRLHDLGKLLFAFSVFWAYIWVCQYLLIWYGNLPEEVPYYVKRTHGPWLGLFALNFVLNWVVPFIALLSAAAKRNPRVLLAVCLILFAGRWLDLYLMIVPALQAAPTVGLYEAAVAVVTLAVALVLVAGNLGRASLVPVNDPVLVADRRVAASPHVQES